VEEGIEETDEEEEPLMTIGDVHRALHPLQATADRVGKQAEQFAESLDRLSSRGQGIEHAETNDILPLVYEYEKVAADTVKRLKKFHESERQQLLKRSFQRQLQKDDGKSTPSDYYQEEDPVDPSTTMVGDLDHWENERQTWQLFGLLLQAHSVTVTPPTGLPETFVRPTHTSKPHPYSTEHDVWDYYLEHSPDMWEKHVVVEWLKSNADNTGQDIDTIVEQLQSGTERGSELWQQSWLYSKEAIKAQKRLRSWPKPLDPASPGIGKSLVNSAGTEGLVTQLDPDAFSRQGRQLAKEDVFLEKATWIACWEMLRRGYTWDSIREWGEDHAELWQSLSMRGDPRPAHDSGQSNKASWRSRALWRKMCMKLARYGGVNEYERAVYGVLSGELASVRKVARTWDDLLFAYYNSQLLQNFDLYVQKTFPERIPSFRSFHHDDDNAIGAIGMDGGQALDVLLHSETTKEEARSPLKLLQGSIIANRTVRYLVAQACALSQVLSSGDAEARKLARRLQQNGSEPTAAIQLSSYDVLRILTHLAFALQDLGQLGASAESIEQIVVAYIDFLGKAGKQQLLPLYASRLSSSGAIECMARQLPFITDNGERKTMLNLMHQYGMDVPGILLMQIVLVTQDQPMSTNVQAGYQPLQILEKLASGRPGVSPIKQNFLSDEIQDDEWDLINGMEWYLLLYQHWNETMYAGSLVYKYMLRKLSFLCAILVTNIISHRLACCRPRALPSCPFLHHLSQQDRGSARQIRRPKRLLRR
jgi:nuclear pore complex protein Nup107